MPVSPATTVLDSLLFRDAFGTERMRAVFSDLALVARCTEVEIALARAEARCGVIPAQAADEIARRCKVAALDFDRAALDRMTDPANYLGLAPAMVDRLLAREAK
jgi:3-carboxy-cis,cis-muconate cycloisomerase